MYSGIVLKNFAPKKQKSLVLDRQRGPIEVICSSKLESKFCNGAVLSYHLTPYRDMYLVEAVDILDVPFAWAREDILFLHHILELLCFFIPSHMSSEPIYDLIVQLYQAPTRSQKLFKKLVIARLFLLLGVCNPVPEQYPDFQNNEMELDAWLLACIAEHPQASYLQTLKFYV